MLEKVKATYKDGTFIPQSPCFLPENVEVELTVQQYQTFSNAAVDPVKRKEILQSLLQRMRQTAVTARCDRAVS